MTQGQSENAPCLPDFYDLVFLDVTDSTNRVARDMAADGAVEGTFVQALTQGAGRGRRGHEWASPPGNLYASLILRPQCDVATAAQISFVTALAIHDAVSEFLPDHEARLKWPNDVLVDQRKIAGILLESQVAKGTDLDWLVVGTGVNIDSFPDQVERPATSLKALGSDATLKEFAECYARHMLSRYRTWQNQGFTPVRKAWLERAWGQGGPVEVRLGNETFSGVFQDLDESGALIVTTPKGNRLVSAGDVYPLLEGRT